jgi:hypothetical protein
VRPAVQSMEYYTVHSDLHTRRISAYPVLSVCSEDLPLIGLGLEGKTESEDIFRKPNANVAGFRSG